MYYAFRTMAIKNTLDDPEHYANINQSCESRLLVARMGSGQESGSGPTGLHDMDLCRERRFGQLQERALCGPKG